MQARREQGLCYRCDEKWHVRHRCKQKELHVLLVSEGDEGVSGDEEFVLEVAEEVEAVELLLNSVVGLSEPHTMKLRGEIQGKEVVVLIDCGAIHNFISKPRVESLQIPR